MAEDTQKEVFLVGVFLFSVLKETYLEPCQISVVEFLQKWLTVAAINYVYKKYLSHTFL